VRLLLDTHAFLWWVSDDPKLSASARRHIADGGNELLLSLASSWEMAVKLSIGKLHLDAPLDRFLPQHMQINAVSHLPLAFDHVCRVSTLPFHHRDPFDRMIAAQALVEGIALVSVDQVFDAYGVERIS